VRNAGHAAAMALFQVIHGMILRGRKNVSHVVVMVSFGVHRKDVMLLIQVDHFVKDVDT